MSRFVAFLRGMNLGGRRITNDELCSAFADLGFVDATAFLASGNVVFAAGTRGPDEVRERLEGGLHRVLGYPVPTFVRTGEKVRAVAAHRPFPPEASEALGGKLQVAFLRQPPSPDAVTAALAHVDDDNLLAIAGRELYWLPSGGISQTELDLAALERLVGPWTMRTHRTVDRLVAKLLDGKPA